jgi:NAD(P)-dependent dehydrogenase (short-subunit alcohol dehydrogenase family)
MVLLLLWGALMYTAVVGAFRISMSELTSVRLDFVLMGLLLMAAAACTAGFWEADTPSGGRGRDWFQTAVAAAICARVWGWHVRGKGFERVELAGRLVVLTGANTGIGLETCRELAQMGATVVLACRSKPRAEAAMAEVQRTPGVERQQLVFMRLDLASMQSVRAFAAAFQEAFGGRALDVLICNAGLMQPQHVLTAEGLELTMAANYLGHFLLVQLLLPYLECSADGGRIVNVASSLHHRGAPPADIPEIIDSPATYSMFAAYIRSKFAQIMFTVELDRRLKVRGSCVCANALHPVRILPQYILPTMLVHTRWERRSLLLFTSPRMVMRAGCRAHGGVPQLPTRAAARLLAKPAADVPAREDTNGRRSNLGACGDVAIAARRGGALLCQLKFGTTQQHGAR